MEWVGWVDCVGGMSPSFLAGGLGGWVGGWVGGLLTSALSKPWVCTSSRAYRPERLPMVQYGTIRARLILGIVWSGWVGGWMIAEDGTNQTKQYLCLSLPPPIHPPTYLYSSFLASKASLSMAPGSMDTALSSFVRTSTTTTTRVGGWVGGWLPCCREWSSAAEIGGARSGKSSVGWGGWGGWGGKGGWVSWTDLCSS